MSCHVGHFSLSTIVPIKGFVFGTESWMKAQRDRLVVEEEIGPQDSVSEVAEQSRRDKSKVSSISGRSSESCTSSVVRMREEAKRAALLAQAALLKKKKEIQLKEANVRAEMEQLELDTAIAASDAKLKVYTEHESPRDGMNDYLQTKLPNTDTHSHAERVLGHEYIESRTDVSRARPVREYAGSRIDVNGAHLLHGYAGSPADVHRINPMYKPPEQTGDGEE